jgi:hypothetical protein
LPHWDQWDLTTCSSRRASVCVYVCMYICMYVGK